MIGCSYLFPPVPGGGNSRDGHKILRLPPFPSCSYLFLPSYNKTGNSGEHGDKDGGGWSRKKFSGVGRNTPPVARKCLIIWVKKCSYLSSLRTEQARIRRSHLSDAESGLRYAAWCIGETLCAIGGMGAMEAVFEAFGDAHGSRGSSWLDHRWSGIALRADSAGSAA